jgi:hypothetical protein
VPLAVLALQQSIEGGKVNVWWRRGASGQADKRMVPGFTAPLDGGGAPALDGAAVETGPAGPARFSMARFIPAILVASMPGIGMLIFSGYLYSVSGNAFAWLEAHQAWGRVYEGVGGLFAGHAKLASELGVYEYSQRQPVDMVNGIAAIAALLLTWPVARRLGVSYAVLLLLMLLPPLAAGGFMSMGRVTSTLFPLFLYLGWAVRGTNRSSLVTACAVAQGFLAALYWTWRPLF